MKRLFPQLEFEQTFRRAESLPDEAHLFAAQETQALHAAWFSRRALLVRGEPGTGKSQLAYAAAAALQSPCIPFVVDARTEARDLRYQLDAVERLAQAQVAGVTGMGSMAVARFLDPGPLWWAFDWVTAEEHAKEHGRPVRPRGAWDPTAADAPPPVLLIDEIDKGDPSVPAGLLEALGDGRFTVPGRLEPVQAQRMPLVIITSNEERSLPDAFVRRCMTLVLAFPGEEQLVRRAHKHFPGIDESVCRKAVTLLSAARSGCLPGQPRPGQAEYLDLLRAVVAMESEAGLQRDLLDELATYAFDKRPPEAR